MGNHLARLGFVSFHLPEAVLKNHVMCGPNLNDISNRQVLMVGFSNDWYAEGVRLDTKLHCDNAGGYEVLEFSIPNQIVKVFKNPFCNRFSLVNLNHVFWLSFEEVDPNFQRTCLHSNVYAYIRRIT